MYVYPAMCFRRDRITGNEQKQVNGTWNAVKHDECVTKQELFWIGIHNTRMRSFSTTGSSTRSKQTSLSFWPMEERLRWFQASHFFWGQPQLQHSLSQPRVLHRTSGEYIHHCLGNPHLWPSASYSYYVASRSFASSRAGADSRLVRCGVLRVRCGMFGAVAFSVCVPWSHGLICQVCRSRSSLCLHPWLEVGTTCQLGLQDGGEILVFEEFLNPVQAGNI